MVQALNLNNNNNNNNNNIIKSRVMYYNFLIISQKLEEVFLTILTVFVTVIFVAASTEQRLVRVQCLLARYRNNISTREREGGRGREVDIMFVLSLLVDVGYTLRGLTVFPYQLIISNKIQK